MDSATLRQTVAKRNEELAAKADDVYTNQKLIPPLGNGPFTALGPVRAVFVHNEGGLAVDSQHRVLDGMSQPISGLYAVGSTGQGGLLLKGHGHHLAWAFVSGRRAGRIAASQAALHP